MGRILELLHTGTVNKKNCVPFSYRENRMSERCRRLTNIVIPEHIWKEHSSNNDRIWCRKIRSGPSRIKLSGIKWNKLSEKIVLIFHYTLTWKIVRVFITVCEPNIVVVALAIELLRSNDKQIPKDVHSQKTVRANCWEASRSWSPGLREVLSSPRSIYSFKVFTFRH